MRCRLATATLLLSLAVLLAAARARGPQSLEALMAQMAHTRGVQAHFHERKEVSLLAAPVESQGMLYFVPPDRFARHTTAPGSSWLIIEGGTLHFRDEVGKQEVDLSSDPIAREFVQHFVVLWSGDLAALRRRYEAVFKAGKAGAWSLRLRPRSSQLRHFLREIQVRGQADAVLEMELVEADGDRSVTHFDAMEADHAFTPAELRQAFPSSSAGESHTSEVP